MTKVISVSVADEDAVLLDDMELSPTGLFRQKLQEVRAHSQNYKNRIIELERNIAKCQERITQLARENEELKESLNKAHGIS